MRTLLPVQADAVPPFVTQRYKADRLLKDGRYGERPYLYKRGCSWNNNANNCIVSNRNNNNATNSNNNVGFRCVSIFSYRTCSEFTAGHYWENPDFYPAPANGTNSNPGFMA